MMWNQATIEFCQPQMNVDCNRPLLGKNVRAEQVHNLQQRREFTHRNYQRHHFNLTSTFRHFTLANEHMIKQSLQMQCVSAIIGRVPQNDKEDAQKNIPLQKHHLPETPNNKFTGLILCTSRCRTPQ